MIRGKYSIYIDGVLVDEAANIITTSGLNLIKKYLTGSVAEWAGALAIGAMNSSSPTVSDSILEYEYARSPIILKSYDTSTGEIVLKATFPTTLVGQIFELGIFSYNNNPFSNGFDDKILFNFDETWYNVADSSSASTTASGRIGKYNYAVASSASSNIFTYSSVDISGYSNSDIFEILYNVSTLQAGTRSATVTFYDNQSPTRGSASLVFAMDTSSTGYKKSSASYANLVKSASFNGRLSQINLFVEGTGKTSVLQLDSLKIRDVALTDENYCLVSRALIGVAGGTSITDYFTKQSGASMDIEYRMTVS